MITRESLAQAAASATVIDPALYGKYNVKRGLRNADGTGVLAGLTTISNVHGYSVIDDDVIPDEGSLTLRGYDLESLVTTIHAQNRHGFEDIAYLLLFGSLPTQEERQFFMELIDEMRDLPSGFVKSLILHAPSDNIMNMMARSILNLYAFDEDADNTSWEHEVAVALSVLSRLARVAPLSYHSYRAEREPGYTMVWHGAIDGLTTAETILYMLRPDQQWTPEEAQVLDALLMIHAEHGGGNNSTFTCRTLTSSGTDPYSAYAGAICSLKGPKHGGANIQVTRMIHDLKTQVENWEDKGQVADYLKQILRGEAFDRSRLIYGMGHAVYTKSDPRAKLCKQYAKMLASGTEWEATFELIAQVEALSQELLYEKTGRPSCANVDMYSGLVYEMLEIPQDLFTPLFATARIAGWIAHRFEELTSAKKIIRPAYKSVVKKHEL